MSTFAEPVRPMEAGGPAPNGWLVIAHYTGGHQDIDQETVYVRADRPEGADREGDWWRVGGTPAQRPVTWGEVCWLDDPACDRGHVELTHYAPASGESSAIDGIPAEVRDDILAALLTGAGDPSNAETTLPPGLYLSDPQGHARLAGINGRELCVVDLGAQVHVGGVHVDDPVTLERFADRLLMLAGRLRARKDGVR